MVFFTLSTFTLLLSALASSAPTSTPTYSEDLFTLALKANNYPALPLNAVQTASQSTLSSLSQTQRPNSNKSPRWTRPDIPSPRLLPRNTRLHKRHPTHLPPPLLLPTLLTLHNLLLLPRRQLRRQRTDLRLSRQRRHERILHRFGWYTWIRD